MKKLIKKAAILLAFLIIIFAGGAFSVWHLFLDSIISNEIHKAINITKTDKDINLLIDKININKKFPYVLLSTKSAKIKYKNNFRIESYIIKDKINFLRAVVAYLLNKSYYGDIHINKLNAHITIDKATGDKSTVMPLKIYLPFDADIKDAHIVIKKGKNSAVLKGGISVTQYPLDINKVYFKGFVNNAKTSFSARIHNKNIAIQFKANIKNINKFGVDFIKGEANINSFKTVEFDASLDNLSYKTIHIKNPFIEGSCSVTKNSVEISKFTLLSNNGFSLKTKGRIDLHNIKNSEFDGSITTSYIDTKPFIAYMKNSVSDYVLGAVISLKDLNFKGKVLSHKFIKNGNILVKSAKFRFDKKSSFFELKDSKVFINEEKIKMIGNGHFDKITFKGSKIVVYRTKGYSCDMDLRYQGKVGKLIRIFLEENVFSKNDLKVLGKTDSLKGEFQADTKIRGYRWAAEPYFDFDINIKLNGVQFNNSNIPSKFVKTWGDVEIKRVVKFGEIKDFYILLKNIKAKGLKSSVITPYTKISLFPKLFFDSRFKVVLWHKNFNYLENALIRQDIYNSKIDFNIDGFFKGTTDNFKYGGYITEHNAVISGADYKKWSIRTKGEFRRGILNINSLDFKADGNMFLSGRINTKNLSYSGNLKSSDFNLSYLNYLSEKKYIPLKKAKLKGVLKFSGQMQELKNIEGTASIRDGEISDNINNINAVVNFNKTKATIKNGEFGFFGNRINLNAILFIKKRSSIVADLSSNNFIFNFDSLKTGKEDYRIDIPPIDLDITFKCKNVTLKKKQVSVNLKRALLKFYNDKTLSYAKFHAYDSLFDIIFHKGKNVNINMKDYVIFSSITDSKMKNNLFKLDANLQTKTVDKIELNKLAGDIKIIAKHGRIKKVSSLTKIFSATNVLELIFAKTKIENDIYYDKIVVPLKLKNGIVRTDKVAILYGRDLNIFADGEYNLVNNFIDIDTTFTTFRTINKIISSIPIVGWIIGGKEKSFTGISLKIKGYVGKEISVKPIPLKSLGKGVLGIIENTITLPLSIFGVKE